MILDESVEPPFSLVNGGWYFIACLIEPDNKTAQYVVGDRGSGTVWASDKLSFTGELNRSCTADLILGMHADSYWYAGGLDDWFLDCDTQLIAEDLMDYFRSSLMANAGDTSGSVDGITEPGAVTLRASSGVYPVRGRADHSGGRLQSLRHGTCVCDQRVYFRHNIGFPCGDINQ